MDEPESTTGSRVVIAPPSAGDGAAGSSATTVELFDDPDLAHAAAIIAAFMRTGVTVTAALAHSGYEAISSNADLITLSTIWLDGPQRPGAISDRTGLTTGGTTNLLHRLETAGYVHRTTEGVDDGRGILVELTASGRTAIEKIADIIATQLLASPDAYDEMRRSLAATGRSIPVLPSSISDTGTQLRDIMRLAEVGRYVTEVLESVMRDPTASRSAMTIWLASGPEHVRPGQLAELTGLSSAGVSELLVRLEERDLVTRTSGRPPDRRAVVVESTATGRALVAQAYSSVMQHLDHVAAVMRGD